MGATPRVSVRHRRATAPQERSCERQTTATRGLLCTKNKKKQLWKDVSELDTSISMRFKKFLRNPRCEKRQVRFLGWFKIFRAGQVFKSVFCLSWEFMEICPGERATTRRHGRARRAAAQRLSHARSPQNVRLPDAGVPPAHTPACGSSRRRASPTASPGPAPRHRSAEASPEGSARAHRPPATLLPGLKPRGAFTLF